MTALRRLMAVPAYAWTVVFFLVPLVLLVVYSFGEINIVTFKVHFGWNVQNYVDIGQRLYLDTILRSVVLSFASTAICLVVGMPVAYFISLQRGSLQYVLLVAVIVPFWTSFIVRTYAWIDVLGTQSPVGRGLAAVGLGGALGTYTHGAIVVGIAANYLPLMILPLYVAFERIDPTLREVAWDLGANRLRAFVRVMIPLALPGVVAGCIIVGVPAMGEYVIPTILGGGKTLMFGNIVADQFQTVGNYPFGAALAVSVMSVVTLVLLLLGRVTASLEEHA